MLKTRCGYSTDNAQIHSLIHVQEVDNGPGFVDIMRKDYGLREGSSAINKGCGIGVAKDISSKPRELNAPDIGAVDYVPGKRK